MSGGPILTRRRCQLKTSPLDGSPGCRLTNWRLPTCQLKRPAPVVPHCKTAERPPHPPDRISFFLFKRRAPKDHCFQAMDSPNIAPPPSREPLLAQPPSRNRYPGTAIDGTAFPCNATETGTADWRHTAIAAIRGPATNPKKVARELPKKTANRTAEELP